MNKPLKTLLYLAIALIAIYFIALRLLNNGSMTPDNSLWSAHIGRDTTVGILPDAYANYYSYTIARTNADMGFKIRGKFPDTRYFSFNVYSLRDNTTQGSIVDYQIKTDSGLPNPFLVDRDSVDAGTDFTVHILPSTHRDIDLPNVLPFRNDVKLLTMVIRLYDYNVDDFGGVDFPTVEAFEITDQSTGTMEVKPVRLPTSLSLRTLVRNFSLPKMVDRLALLYKTENTPQLDGPKDDQKGYTTPFHAIDTKGFIENNDNRYLLSAITKQDDEIYLFKFKAPTYTTGPADINKTDVRYWSFNLGNAATYNFNAIKDEDAILDTNGYVHILLGDKDPKLERRASELGYNFMEWNMPWKKGFILFRHMLAHPDFEAQIDDVPAINIESIDFEPMEGHRYMGDYAPEGKRMTKTAFMTNYQSQ